jgi:hypothetical protein
MEKSDNTSATAGLSWKASQAISQLYPVTFRDKGQNHSIGR